MKLNPKPRLIVLAGDIHAGSTVALLPPKFTTLEGEEIGQNLVQAWLWKCWLDATTAWLPSIIAGDPYAFICTGDAVEGCHHGTKQIISPDVADHVEAARQILSPLASKAARTFLVKGTEVHTGTTESALGKILGAEKDPETKQHAFDRLSLIACGVRMIVQHHIATSSRMYLAASALGIALGNEQLEAVNNGEMMPKILVSAHRHVFGQYQNASGLCLVTHCWQALTRHGNKYVPSARTKPGLVVLDWREREDGELPEVHSISYSPPAGKGLEL